jgi:hypothetical protein
MRRVATAILPILFLAAASIIPSASAQSIRVTGIPQIDCPVVVEQQENARDGSLTTADFKNFSEKTVDSIRIGWIADSGEPSKEAALGMSTRLRPGLTSKGRVTVAAKELGLAPGTTGRLKFFVASGHFSDGSSFVCSARSMRSRSAKDSHIVAVHDPR